MTKASLWGAALLLLPVAAQAQEAAPYFTAAQVEAGKEVFGRVCFVCHKADLSGTEIAPPLMGASFASNWSGQAAEELLEFVMEEMPQTAPGSLDRDSYLRVVAYILSFNGLAAGATELTVDDPGVIRIATK